MFSCIVDLFFPDPSGPTFDLFLTYLNYFGVSGPSGRPQFHNLSAPNLQRFLRFAIVMPIANSRNRSDFRDKKKQCCIAI